MGLDNYCKLYMVIYQRFITTIDEVKLLGVIIDSKLKFDEHGKSCIRRYKEVNLKIFNVKAL